ncbi:MAG: BMP family ABC transporter substrate-binding protein, partial [Oscillospiraceae bacterium]|nr:BMP family ABC transporter substrate-binding protein [Oscillospiraceae bacterium]
MKYKKFLAMLLCGVFLLAGCGGDNGEDEDGEERRGLGGLGGLLVAHEEEDPYPLDVKIAFIYSGAVGSDTLIEHFELTRGELERTLGVETCYIDNVRLQQFPEAVEIAVDAGCNIIVAASYSYGSSVVLAARRFHEISFISFGNTDTAHNLSNVQPLLYQAAHVNGIIAGWNTDSNKIGVVADINMYNAHGIVNAFALGVRDITYAQIDFSINWALSQNFADTRAAIDDLISQGCDIIFIYQSEEYGFRRCEELGIRVQGFAHNVPELAPENFLTGMYLNMNTYFIDKVRTVMYGN